MKRFFNQTFCLSAWMGLLIAVAAPAHGLSCGHQSDVAAAVRGIGILFEGRISTVDVRPPSNGAQHGEVIMTMQVLQRWKGNIPDVVHIRSNTFSAIPYSNQMNGAARIIAANRAANGDIYTDVCNFNGIFGPGLEAFLNQLQQDEFRFSTAVARAPDNIPERLARARFFETWRDEERATQEYGEILRRAPQDIRAILGIARMVRYRTLAQPQIFLVHMQQLLGRFPDDPDVARLMGQARLAAGDFSGLASVDFKEIVLSGVNLSQRDLRGRDFSGAMLFGVNFSGSDLRGANFEGVEFRNNISFIGADLRESRFVSVLNFPQILRSDLRGAVIRQSALHFGLFDQTRIRGLSLDQVQFESRVRIGLLELTEIDLSDATITNSTFARLDNVRLTGAQLTNVRFGHVSGVNFDDATLRDVRFGPVLEESSFVGARLEGVNLSGSKLGDVDFTGARITPRNAGLAQSAVRAARENGADLSRAARPAGRPTRSAN